MDDNLKVEWIIKMYNDVICLQLHLNTDLQPHSALLLDLATHYH